MPPDPEKDSQQENTLANQDISDNSASVNSENAEKLTPMIAQYRSIKKDYPDALLFYRMGDFYELFFEDAVTASRELQIALTSRGKTEGASIPMCGVPWHAYQSYLAQLIDKGYNVAICEQMEDPRNCKGIVPRAVTCVVTPGTSLDEANLGAKSHNYLGAVFCGIQNTCAFAWADISTGQWSGIEFKRQADLWQWVRKLSPRELLLVDGQQTPAAFNQEGIRLVHQPSINFELRRAGERIMTAQAVQELEALGLEGKPSLIRACGALLGYLEQTQLRQTTQLMPFHPLDLGRRLIIDDLTERNLEIFSRLNGRKGKGTLRFLMDSAITPMGGRFLEDMLKHPWRDLRPIRQIQEIVAWLAGHDGFRASLREELERIFDLERLIMRICLNRATLRDYLGLRQSLKAVPEIRQLICGQPIAPPDSLAKILNSMDDLADCASLLESALVEELQDISGDAGIFREGFNAALDKQLDLLSHGEARLQALLEKEKKETGISKLKIGNNRVLGYYLEVPRSASGKEIPERFVRKQSLANCERYATEELKNLEEDLLLAAERRKELESQMLENLRSNLAAQKERILQTADILAQLDYWQSLAEVGRRENWVMPIVTNECEIHITQGRHPVVESIIGKANFVPNDFHMEQGRHFCLLTGPNMAGKSTILRQTALICLLAQIGSMVPARAATIGMVDRLFSRVGASDNLAQGQSTFMVEMMETARILRQSTKRSFVILDEIGRGTSTYDGMAIAWAVVEELAARVQGQVRTIFATHYHELTALEGKVPGLFTMNVAVGSYDNNEILFLHRLLPGPADRSYGVEVARLAGVPYPVVQRARNLLKSLEQTNARQSMQRMALPGINSRGDEKGALDLLQALRQVDMNELSPEGALELVGRWKKNWAKGAAH